MKARARLAAQAALLVSATLPGDLARAATFVIDVVDEAGVGFNDPTPATPVGGNPGTTVGEQRRIVFQTAADAWGRILESPVPIVVEASFAELTCSEGSALAGHAGALSVSDYPGLPTTGRYPLALANRIMGRDLYPSEPDIRAEFNSGLAECLGKDWYYGLDQKEANQDSNLLSVVLHELTHGLGFADGVDPDTGAFVGSSGAPNLFAEHVLDRTTGKHWVDMNDDERKASLANVRNLVWDGERVKAVAARVLAKGLPSVQVSPALGGFSGVVGEANYGRLVADGAELSGQVGAVTVPSTCVFQSSTFSGLSGKVALVFSPRSCSSLAAAYYAEKGGAVAMLFANDVSASPPPVALAASTEQKAKYPVSIPTLALTLDDANLLKNAPAGTNVTMSADQGRLVGADAAGHTQIFASDPVRPGSTGAHWDPLVRPDLTEEPVETAIPHSNLEMERALLWDLGWTAACGDGTVDSSEECDDGAGNSDHTPDACRLDCKRPRCGDGAVDTGEQCDPGFLGVGKKADASCRADCTLVSAVGTGGSTGAGGSGRGGAGGSGGSGGGGQAGSGGSGAGGQTGTGGSSSAGSGGQGGSATGGGSGGSTQGGTSGGGSKKSGGCACNTAGASSPSGVLVLIVGLALVLGRRARAFASLLAHDPPRTARTTTAPAASMAPHIQGSRKR